MKSTFLFFPNCFPIADFPTHPTPTMIICTKISSVFSARNEKAEWLRGCSRNPTQADGWAFFVFCRRIKKRGNKP
jgi:hypothetical protein